AQEVGALWGRRLLQSRTVFLAGGDVLQWPAVRVNDYLTSLARVFPIASDPVTPSSRSSGESRSEGQSDRNPVPTPTDAAPHFDGVHIFWDDFAPRCPDRDDWRQFSAAGLNRVSIGIASGNPDIRAFYHQHWSDQELRTAFAELKSAGIGASVLTLVGGGGAQHAATHVRDTATLITSLDLAPGDFVFLLDENELR